MYQLRPYQQEAVDRTVQYFKRTRDPAVIVLPTGAGKSVVIAELARIARGRVLVLAHVKELVEQNFQKFYTLNSDAGLYSAGLGQKDITQKAIFGSIQSVARAPEEFFKGFSLLIIDECHRVSEDGETQYQEVIQKLREQSPDLRILGLTATPYRLGLGWIFEYSHAGELKSREPRFFKHCVFELPLEFMIKHRYLTQPVKVDIPVTSYDFSELTEKGRMYTAQEVEELLTNQKHLTPLIIKNIIDISERFQRHGVMIFASNVKHAQEILGFLPSEQSRLVTGETTMQERDQIIQDFKQKKFKYLVNVSVLTTGFDAPHVDVVAILRPTESNSLYQQIVGRGLRLDPGKKDCIILDYTGMGHDLYRPEVSERRPHRDATLVEVPCPVCSHVNHFWGELDHDGHVVEHSGQKCQGAKHDPLTLKVIPCGHRFRFKLCATCGEENDLQAQNCESCHTAFTSAAEKIKLAKLSKNAHVLTPVEITFNERLDKNGRPYLEVRYYDADGQYLSEAHFFNHQVALKKFNINFLRSHLRRPELAVRIQGPQDVIQMKSFLRLPAFVIARKQEKFWKITEKVFAEELRS